MTIERIDRLGHEHSDAWPHDDTHHLMAAFAVLLVGRGQATIDGVAGRLAELQVAHGVIERDRLVAVFANLDQAGLIERRPMDDPAEPGFELTAEGRKLVDDWALIMRDRRRLSRSFLALYDRVDD